DPRALALAQTLAVLGDGCELRHAAAVAGLDMAQTLGLVADLVRLEVLATDDPPQLIHPVIRAAPDAALADGSRELTHRSTTSGLHGGGGRGGQGAVYLVLMLPAAQ